MIRAQEVPSLFRPAVWQLLSGASASPLHERYGELLVESSAFEKAIRRDIARTYPTHDYFKDEGGGQESLFNVIKAYSIVDREVGYCQGKFCARRFALRFLRRVSDTVSILFWRVVELGQRAAKRGATRSTYTIFLFIAQTAIFPRCRRHIQLYYADGPSARWLWRTIGRE